MRHQQSASALSLVCILALSACGGGTGGGVGDPETDNGLPPGLPNNQNLLVSHASVDSGQAPALGASVINIIDEDTITVSVGGQVYELERTGLLTFETADGLASLTIPEDPRFSGDHAGVFHFETEIGPDTRSVSQLVGVADAYDAIPGTGMATFTGGARTYRTSEFGSTFINDSWDVEVIANFQVQGVGVTMTNNQYTLVMDPAGIQNNGGVAYFEETLTSNDNPNVAVTNGTMSGLFYGGGQEVGGRFAYDVDLLGTESSVTGVFHAD